MPLLANPGSTGPVLIIQCSNIVSSQDWFLKKVFAGFRFSLFIDVIAQVRTMQILRPTVNQSLFIKLNR